MKELQENSDQLHQEMASLNDKFNRIGNTNKEIEDKIDYIYERQREVAIGKRNINCLSCSEEPDNVTLHGADGKVYRGSSAERKTQN